MIIEKKLEIYPRTIWITNDLDTALNKFTFVDSKCDEIKGIEEELRQNSGTDSINVVAVCSKETNELGVLVIFYDLDSSNGTIAHECIHVADYIYDSISAYTQSYEDGNEPYAYLVGYIFDIIEEARDKIFDDEYDNDNR